MGEMKVWSVWESVEYTIEAETEEEAREIATEWPERDPSYRLLELIREVVPYGEV